MMHIYAWLSDIQVLVFFFSFLIIVALSLWQDSELLHLLSLPIQVKTKVETYIDKMTRQNSSGSESLRQFVFKETSGS